MGGWEALQLYKSKQGLRFCKHVRECKNELIIISSIYTKYALRISKSLTSLVFKFNYCFLYFIVVLLNFMCVWILLIVTNCILINEKNKKCLKKNLLYIYNKILGTGFEEKTFTLFRIKTSYNFCVYRYLVLYYYTYIVIQLYIGNILK